jgi:isopentenyl diphosphate isomerase/L-lactate dehydrogenase-like FMN-dependent dehydrogenase
MTSQVATLLKCIAILELLMSVPRDRVQKEVSTSRRNLLLAPVIFGASAIFSKVFPHCEASAQVVEAPQAPLNEASPSAAAPKTHYGPSGVSEAVAEVYQKARTALYPICRVCPQCDGVACAGEFPGMGGVGRGLSFQNNFNDLQKIRLKMRILNAVGPMDRKPDTSTLLFGHKISLPAIAAPIGGMGINFRHRISEEDFVEAIIGGCVDAGSMGAIGDGIDPKATMQLFEKIGRYQGRAIAGIKPRPQATFLEMIRAAEAQNAAMITIDIDSAGRYSRANPTWGTKTVAELSRLIHSTKIPFVIKGVMSPEDAIRAAEAGAAGIVVSNHGGRVLDGTPGTAAVLPVIAKKVGGKMTILVDGCVSYGVDVLRYLALGANAVLVGRHLARAAFGGGRKGVQLFMQTMRDELEAAMVLVGAANVRAINHTFLA